MAAVARYPDRPGCDCGCAGAVGTWAMPRLVSYSLACDERRRARARLSVRAQRLVVAGIEHAHPGRALLAWAARARDRRALQPVRRHGVLPGPVPRPPRRAVAAQRRCDGAVPRASQEPQLRRAGRRRRSDRCCAVISTRSSSPMSRSCSIATPVRTLSLAKRCTAVAASTEPTARSSTSRCSSSLADHLGRAVVPPFNLGVVLYNHGVVARLAGIMATFVDDAWRLMTGLTIRGFPNSDVAGDASFPWMADVTTARIGRRPATSAPVPFEQRLDRRGGRVVARPRLDPRPDASRLRCVRRRAERRGARHAARPSPVGAVSLLLAQPHACRRVAPAAVLARGTGSPSSHPSPSRRQQPSAALER